MPSHAVGAEPVPSLPGVYWAAVRLPRRPDPSLLTDAEQRIFEALGSPRREREWLAGRVAAHAALDPLGGRGFSVVRGEGGAPRLEGPGAQRFEVAITHGRSHAAAIASLRTSEYPHVGIDWVDGTDARRIRRIASRFLSESEKTLCRDADRNLQLAWGVREALAKATQTGMFQFALAGVHLTAIDESAGAVSINVAGTEVRYLPGPAGAVVVLARVSAATRSAVRAGSAGRTSG